MARTPTSPTSAATAPGWRPEIDQYTIKFLIGLVALLLPAVEYAVSHGAISSISDSYWYRGSSLEGCSYWSRNLFVGSLFAIAAMLCGYNGTSSKQLWFGKLAAASALLIANFPCACGDDSHESMRGVHAASAAVLFAVLAWFCLDFIERAKTKLHGVRKTAAGRRIVIYKACAVGMFVGIGLIAFHALFAKPGDPNAERLVFWGESFGLVSFGLSWLTASRKLPGITHPSERQTVWGFGSGRSP